MTDASWPDPQRPGVPLNPERDGWHWIDVAGDVIVARWWAEDSSWTWGVHRWTAQIASKAAWFYHGPAMTPADLAAHSAAAAREMREKAAAMCRVNKRAAELFADPGRDDERTAYTRACGDILRTIAALPLPGADALDRALAQKRREALGEAARVADKSRRAASDWLAEEASYNGPPSSDRPRWLAQQKTATQITTAILALAEKETGDAG